MGKGKSTMTEPTAISKIDDQTSDEDKADKASAKASDLGEETRALERKADAIRREVDLLIAEADRRRHRILSRQLHKHPVVSAGAALLVGAGLVGVTALLVRRYQQRHSITGWLNELGRATAHLVRHPDSRRVVREDSSLGMKLVAAFGTAAAGTLARRSVSGLVKQKS
jgi:hypothetical protein